MRIKDKYISPFTDFGFKKLFGTEMNKDILMEFLNALLKKEEGKIVDLTYLPLEQLGTIFDERKAIFDIYCENEKGEKFIKTSVVLYHYRFYFVHNIVII